MAMTMAAILRLGGNAHAHNTQRCRRSAPSCWSSSRRRSWRCPKSSNVATENAITATLTMCPVSFLFSIHSKDGCASAASVCVCALVYVFLLCVCWRCVRLLRFCTFAFYEYPCALEATGLKLAFLSLSLSCLLSLSLPACCISPRFLHLMASQRSRPCPPFARIRLHTLALAHAIALARTRASRAFISFASNGSLSPKLVPSTLGPKLLDGQRQPATGNGNGND